MKQPQLFNTAPMASTQAIQALRRARGARALASFSKGSTMITADNSNAKPATVPGASLKLYGARSAESAMEFNLPDEDRVLCTVYVSARCPCGSLPELVRGLDKFGGLFKSYYQLRCKGCENRTQWVESSGEALQLWNVVNALTKP